jgi:stage V sporulation protein K
LHAACSFQASADVVETLLKAYPGGASQPNGVGNLPIHQAAMWQAPMEAVEMLLSRHAEGAAVRNQYGSLPLHMAASNRASPEVIKLLIDAYPDALHLQNDDGMTPLDLAMADETMANDQVLAMLEGRPPPPELTRRQKAERYEERATLLERKARALRLANPSANAGGPANNNLKLTLAAVRKLADRFPHALYTAGMDPNELEIAFSDQLEGGNKLDAEQILLDAVRKRAKNQTRDARGLPMDRAGMPSGPRDRVEELLASIIGLDHIKSQLRGLRRTAEICDLKESLIPPGGARGRSHPLNMIPPALAEDTGRPAAHHTVFLGNPGTGKTAVARLLAKAYHELGILRKPKFLEVERMDLVGRDRATTIVKTKEVVDEARGGILFIDEAYTLGMASKRNKLDTGADCINEIIRSIDESAKRKGEDNHPLVIFAGFPVEMNTFLVFNTELRKRFPLTFEFPDYTCLELAQIFTDLANAKGFDLTVDLKPSVVAQLLEAETTDIWRSERNGRISEMLLTGCRTEVRKRMRTAQMEDDMEFDPQMIIQSDVENVIRADFK